METYRQKGGGDRHEHLKLSIKVKYDKEEIQMKELIKRILTTMVVFFALYFFLPLLVQYKSYDVYVQSICVLASVIGAGFYWVGSKN